MNIPPSVTWEGGARLAWDFIAGQRPAGIPSWLLNPMDHALIERLAGTDPGSYRQQPEATYLAMQQRIGTCFLDQWIPRNPLSMGGHGYEDDTAKGATTGGEVPVCDGVRIDSPEAVAEHLEHHEFPRLEAQLAVVAEPTIAAEATRLIAQETAVQAAFGPGLLKVPYDFAFPDLRYYQYGYANYFMAYKLFPELMERHFRLQADLAVRRNTGIARAIRQAGLPPLIRLDHDMTDDRGTLVDLRSLDRLWLPHFARAITPLLEGGVRLLWHCDGNITTLVPRLIEAGISGFQGFQYECGVDYAALCRTRDRQGRPLMIWAGVSVTTTLPHGTPDDVRRELRRLVETAGPEVELALGASSSIVPGTPHANVLALVEGLAHYRTHGRVATCSR